MKSIQIKMMAFITSMMVSGIAYGYTFNFKSGFKQPVTVRVKLSGVNEPWYYGKIKKAGETYSFAFQVNSQLATNMLGTKKEYVGRKAGMCLTQIQVAPYVLVDGRWKMSTAFIDCAPSYYPDAILKQLLKANELFQAGSTAAAGKLMKDVNAAMKTEAGRKEGGIIGTYSLCQSIDFTVLPDLTEQGTAIPSSYVIATIKD